MYEVKHFVTEDGRNLFLNWQDNLKDKRVERALDRRITRIIHGNFGDHKPCRDGVWELRIDIGPGYRIYYSIAGNSVVLLLCGGNKSSQASDISKACECWKIWQKNNAKKGE